MERTGRFERPFSDPITVRRFVADVVYVRNLVGPRGLEPRLPG